MTPVKNDSNQYDNISDLVPCSICGRKFAEDRVAKHKVGPDDSGDDEDRYYDDERGQLVVVMVMISIMLTYEAGLDNDVEDGEAMMRMTTMVMMMMQRTKLRHTRLDEIIKALLRNPSRRPAQRGFSS